MESPDKQAQQMRDALTAICANKELLETVQQEVSKLAFQRFQSLVEAGFTPEQALEVIKARGIMP